MCSDVQVYDEDGPPIDLLCWLVQADACRERAVLVGP